MSVKEMVEGLFVDEQSAVCLRGLIEAAVTAKDTLRPYALSITHTLRTHMPALTDESIKLLCIQLLSEILVNYAQLIPALGSYDLECIVRQLSQDNVEVRKNSHNFLTLFFKKYNTVDPIFREYMKQLSLGQSQKVIQKIIYSFEGLLHGEARCISFVQDYKTFGGLVEYMAQTHENGAIDKAAQRTVDNLVKNQYLLDVLYKLPIETTNMLIERGQRLGVGYFIEQNKIQSNKKPTKTQAQTKTESRGSVKKGDPARIQKSVSPRSMRSSLASSRSQQKQKSPSALQVLLNGLQKESDWKLKEDLIEKMMRELQSDTVHTIPKDMIDVVLDMSYDCNFKVCVTSMQILYSLITKYTQDAEKRVKKLQDITIDKMCDIKTAVREIAVKIMKKLLSMSKDTLKKILAKLGNCSVVGKEQILKFLQQYYSVCKDVDLGWMLPQIALQMQHQNTKVKIKTIDCLIKITLNNDIEECKAILQKKLNRTYLQMFLERLRQSTFERGWEDKWDQKSFQKGMTWQAERPLNINDKANTRVQFSKKPHKVQEESIYDFDYQLMGDESPQVGSKIKQNNTIAAESRQHTHQNTLESKQSTFQTTDARQKFGINTNVNPKEHSLHRVPKNRVKEEEEERKAPLKPTPIKKMKKQNKEEETNLIVQSREYRNKNEDEKSWGIRAQKSQDNKASKKVDVCQWQHQIDYKATQYAVREELLPAQNPWQLLKDVSSSLLKDSQWSKQFQGLDGLRRLLKHHEDIYAQLRDRLPLIMPEVLRLVDSLRSTVSKNAMITLAEMCESLKKDMDPYLESIFTKLFKKSQDANSFIVEEVRECILLLCCYCSTQKICAVIVNNAQAKAAAVKIRVGQCIGGLLMQNQYNVQLFIEQPKILSVFNNLIQDGAVEVRNVAKEIFKKMVEYNGRGKIEGFFKKGSRQSWEKWKYILERQIK